MNLKNYLEQHHTIAAEIEVIKKLVLDSDIEKNASDIALHISTLAGKIKVHLSMEDKYMYPELEKSEDEHIKEMAEKYQREMGNLAEDFTLYKDKYNTKLKILNHKQEIKSETTNIFGEIEQRVHKEESELYQYIK